MFKLVRLAKRPAKYAVIGGGLTPIAFGLQAGFTAATGLSEIWGYTFQGLVLLWPSFWANEHFTWADRPVDAKSTFLKWCAVRLPILAVSRFANEQLLNLDWNPYGATATTIAVFGAGMADGTPFYAMEFVRGKSLKEVIAAGPPDHTPYQKVELG